MNADRAYRLRQGSGGPPKRLARRPKPDLSRLRAVRGLTERCRKRKVLVREGDGSSRHERGACARGRRTNKPGKIGVPVVHAGVWSKRRTTFDSRNHRVLAEFR